MQVFLTPDDLKVGDLAEVGWHPAEVVNYEETAASDNAKNPGSTNCTWYFKIIDGVSKGLEVKKLINEHPKSLGYNKSLWKTFGFPIKDGGYQLSSQLFKQTVGFKLMIYVKRGKSSAEFGGREYNDIVDFKPLS